MGVLQVSLVEAELTKTAAAIERYLTAFENGTLPEATCSHRVEKLSAKLVELQGRRDELGLLLDETAAPAKPSIDVLKALHNYVRHTLQRGDADDIRSVAQALVHRVDITGRHKALPTFNIPTDPTAIPTQRTAADAPDNNSQTKVRTLPGLVHPTRHCTNPNLQVSGLEVTVKPVHAKFRRDGYRRY